MYASLFKMVAILLAGMIILSVLKMLLGKLEPSGSSRTRGTASKLGDLGPLPYKRCDGLMTKTELSFYRALEYATEGQYRVFAKVRLEDLIYVPTRTEQRQGFRNRIKSRHVDYVLCEADSLRPMLAIELDDATHRATRRQERDAFVDSALASAGMPILRVPVARAYDSRLLAERIAARTGVRAMAA